MVRIIFKGKDVLCVRADGSVVTAPFGCRIYLVEEDNIISIHIRSQIHIKRKAKSKCLFSTDFTIGEILRSNEFEKFVRPFR